MYNITRLREWGACGTNFTPFKTRVPKYILLPGLLYTMEVTVHSGQLSDHIPSLEQMLEKSRELNIQLLIK